MKKKAKKENNYLFYGSIALLIIILITASLTLFMNMNKNLSGKATAILSPEQNNPSSQSITQNSLQTTEAQLNPAEIQKYKVDFNSEEIRKAPSSVQDKLKKMKPEEQAKLNKKLQETKETIKEKGAMWEAGFNEKSILTDEEFSKTLGLKGKPPKRSNSNQGITGNLSLQPGENLPDNFDWRNVNGVNYMSSIKDQGKCGSCWAFASVATLEGHARTFYNNPNLNLDLSEQDLVSCAVPYSNGLGGVLGQAQIKYTQSFHAIILPRGFQQRFVFLILQQTVLAINVQIGR